MNISEETARKLTVSEGRVLLEVRDSTGWIVKSVNDMARDAGVMRAACRKILKRLKEMDLVVLVHLQEDEYDQTLRGSGYARTYEGDKVAKILESA